MFTFKFVFIFIPMCLSQYLYIPIKCINILVILIISDRLVFANACKDQLFVSGKTRRSVPWR